jgi:transposase
MHRQKKNKERYSLLSAISKEGNVRYVIHKDNIDGIKYTQFIEENKDIFIGKTIIQDNVRFHHSRVLKEFCNSSNIGLHYIPAYTPDANPIEHPK